MNAWMSRMVTTVSGFLALACAAVILAGTQGIDAQERGASVGEWRYIGGDAFHTRYLPLDQINAGNFEKLQVAWVWRGDNFGPTVQARSSRFGCLEAVRNSGALHISFGRQR